jgi:hypothetical protein
VRGGDASVFLEGGRTALGITCTHADGERRSRSERPLRPESGRCFGHGRYGVEEAARYFFGKSIADVGVGEAVLLAGLLQQPERLSPYKHPDAAKKRQIYVLGQMARLEYIYDARSQALAYWW